MLTGSSAAFISDDVEVEDESAAKMKQLSRRAPTRHKLFRFTQLPAIEISNTPIRADWDLALVLVISSSYNLTYL
jgi:hypothetical protein